MPKKEQKIMGRPPVEITPALRHKAKSLAAQGLNMEQIARCLGMGASTLYAKQAEFKELSEDIKDGQAMGVSVIVNAMFENARGLTITEDKIIKDEKGVERVVQIERKLAPNVVAGIFYLKNRGEWKDKQDVEHSGNVTHKHEGISRTTEILREFRGERSEESTERPLPH